MSLRASALKTNEQQKKALQREVNSILSHMDDEIKVSHEQGKSSATLSLPITFAIPYMKNNEAQRIIYYKLLQSLLDRGFIPQIELGKNMTLFHISWLTEDERTEIESQSTLLAKYTKKTLVKDL